MSDRFDHRLKHTLESKADESDADVDSFRRIELITGTGRRRRWSVDDKARILFESLKPDANVSEVARRNGLSPQQLFGWRREVRDAVPLTIPRPRGRPKKQDLGLTPSVGAATSFAAVVVTAAPGSPPLAGAGLPDYSQAGTIEITIGDAAVRVSGQIDMAQLAAVLRAVRRAS